MRKTTIMRGDRFSVDSLGFGWGYVLTDHEAGKSAFVQDDDARQFRKDLAIYERRFPHKTVDGVLSRMWFDHELCLIAEAA